MVLFILILSGLLTCNSGYSIGSDTNSLFKCSTFHYEEKVLEKLVRLEHKMEVYSDKMEKLEASINNVVKTTGESNEETVAFTACSEMDKLMKKDEPILFPLIITSFGVQNMSALPTLGQFRTERPGLYFITMTCTVSPTMTGTNFRIYRNSTQHLLDVYATGMHRYFRRISSSSSSGSVVLYLDRDDQITVNPDSNVYSISSSVNATKATCLTIVKIK